MFHIFFCSHSIWLPAGYGTTNPGQGNDKNIEQAQFLNQNLIEAIVM
jgi:hypothetical protein